MSRLNLLKSLLGIVVACCLSQTAIAGHGHGGGGGHHGSFGGGGHYSGGHYHGGGYRGGYGGWGYGGWGYPGYGFGYGYGSGFSLSIGSGYPGYGYYGYGGYGGSPYYYSAPSYYYAPPAYYYGAPISSSSTYNYPPMSQSVAVQRSSTASTRSFDRSPIVLTNPATNDKPVEYSLNGHRYSMSPGQSQKFTHDRDWIVEFGRGNGQSSAKYGLKSAAYKFKPTAHGWELFQAAEQSSVAKIPAPPKPGNLEPQPAGRPRPETFVLDTDSTKPSELKPAEFQADKPKPVTVGDVKAASSQPPETVVRQRKSTKSSDSEEPAPGPKLAAETEN